MEAPVIAPFGLTEKVLRIQLLSQTRVNPGKHICRALLRAVFAERFFGLARLVG